MRKSLLIIFPALIAFAPVVAQQDQPDKDLTTDITIIKSRKIELPEAQRNFDKANLPEAKKSNIPLTYTTKDVEIKLPKMEAKMQIIKVAETPPKLSKGNYVKAGFGNYGTPYLEGYFNNNKGDRYNYGLHLLHLSSARGPKPFKNYASVSQTGADLTGSYFMKGVVLRGGAGYSRSKYNYYGFNQERAFNKDTIRQVYSVYSVTAGAESARKDAKAYFRYNGGFYYLTDKFKASEYEFMLNGNVRYNLKDTTMYISSRSQTSISQRKAASTVNRTLYQIRPAFNLSMERFLVQAGLNIAFTNDTVGGKFHLYPNLYGAYYLLPGTITAFAGLDGEMQKNTLRSFVAQNPYLSTNTQLLHTNKQFDIYAGVKGNVLNVVNYRLKASYALYKNLYIFNNSKADTSKFVALYSGNNTSIVSVSGDLGYELSDRFRVGLNANYYQYNISPDTLKAWHRPNFLASVLSTYNLREKIYFNLDMYFLTGLRGKNFVSGKEVKLPEIIDLNFKVDYRFSETFSAFIEFNNILSRKYQRYLYYPVKGINIIGGLTYSF